MEIHSPSKAFSGVRFVLLGFDSINESKVRAKLVDGGGVDVGQYNSTCTHVIVDRILYDDPRCVAARSDGKTCVTALWVDHSYDIGMPVVTSSVMYKPPKDLNGIPGAKSLVICLTGYQRQDREDIMTMVGLMGAHFSKPLVANKVTHLVCYKFEGEKYELAKKLPRMKLVNHHWLEDCLRDWELLPEANYAKSGYELEIMEAEAKDSDEEAEDGSVKQYMEKGMNKSPHSFRIPMASTCEAPNLAAEEQKVPVTSTVPAEASDIVNMKGSVSTPGKDVKSNQFVSSFNNVSVPEGYGCEVNGSCSDAFYERTPNSTAVEKDLASTSRKSELLSYSEPKLSNPCHSRKTPQNTALSMSSRKSPGNVTREANLGGSNVHVSGISSFKGKHAEIRDSTICTGTSQLDSKSCHEESSGLLPLKRMSNTLFAGSRSLKMKSDAETCSTGSALVNQKTQAYESKSLLNRSPDTNNQLYTNDTSKITTASNSHARVLTTSPLSLDKQQTSEPHSFTTVSVENGLNNKKVSETSVRGLTEASLASYPELEDIGMEFRHVDAEAKELHNQQHPVEIPSPSKKDLEPNKSCKTNNVDLPQGTNDKLMVKPLRKKTVGKKALGSKHSANQKGSIYSNGIVSPNYTAVGSNGGKERFNQEVFCTDEVETSPPTVSVEATVEGDAEVVAKSGDDTINKIEAIDDLTEAPEEKDEHQLEKALDGEKSEGTGLMHKDDTKPSVRDVDNSSIAKGTCRTEERKNCGEKFSLDKSTSKGDTMKGKINKGKKRPLGNARSKTLSVDNKTVERSTDGEAMNEEKNTEKEMEKEGKLHVGSKSCIETASENQLNIPIDVEKENRPDTDGNHNSSSGVHHVGKSILKSMEIPLNIKKKFEVNSNSTPVKEVMKTEPVWFILSGHRLQRKEFQQLIRRLKGKCCRDSHQWSYQATHFIASDLRRTEKFFAAAASGRWILKNDYISACSSAGKLLAEEPYEWHKIGLSEDGAINLEAPRKWRLLRERTGHGAFHGMRIIVYGECIAPPLDTLKRVVKAGDGTILATSPPYTRFLKSGVDFAVISPGMPRVDLWVQEFLKHEIPCVVADYLVEFVCKPGYSLERHVLYNTHAWAEKSFANMLSKAEEIVPGLNSTISCSSNKSSDDIICQVCGSADRGEVMLICGDEIGSVGCGVGTHIDCCDPPLEGVPEDDWFCLQCKESSTTPSKKRKKGRSLKKRERS